MVNLKTGTENDHGNKALFSSEEKQAVASRWQHCVRFTSKRAALPGAIMSQQWRAVGNTEYDLLQKELRCRAQ